MHLQHMEEPTVVLEVEGGERDVVGYARDGEDACVTILRIRGGKLLGREHRFLEHIEDEPDAGGARRVPRCGLPELFGTRSLLFAPPPRPHSPQ